MTDHTDDPLEHLIAANERLHAEVQRLTDEHVRLTRELAFARGRYETMSERFQAFEFETWTVRRENLTLRADLATSEQTIAALKAQLQRVKEAAE